jgi:hypothetical protein
MDPFGRIALALAAFDPLEQCDELSQMRRRQSVRSSTSRLSTLVGKPGFLQRPQPLHFLRGVRRQARRDKGNQGLIWRQRVEPPVSGASASNWLDAP